MTLDEILSRLTNVKRSGDKATARCPAHADSQNSLSIAKAGDGKLLIKCFAGCPVESICAALSIDVKDLFPPPVPKLAKRTRAAVTSKPVTLKEFADAKRLPIDWLSEQGLEDFPDGSGIAIGYFGLTGEQHSQVRKRIALKARDGSFWLGEGSLIPYGIWKLNSWRSRSNFLVILEGESDALTAWHCGYAAIGVPGATNTRCLEAAYVAGFGRIVAVSEADAAGQKFPGAVATRLREVGYTGRIDTLRMGPSGFKDISALYLDNPEGFREAFDTLLKEAEKNAEAGDTALRTVSIYSETESGLVRQQADKKKGDVVATYPLTNFNARIVSDLERDDGAEKARAFEITSRLDGRSITFTVPVAQFAGMRWATEHLGAEAVVYAGQGTADHTRAAIQLLSGRPPRRTIFAHTGWRKISTGWVYLDNAGAIGPNGRIDEIAVELPPELANLKLELPRSLAECDAAIRASLRLLDLAPDPISVPAYGTIWRAILGGADFSKFLYGRTGAFKTEFSALIQQHFGRGFDARHLPTAFTSTANTNELLAFTAKDAVFVVDEFHPPASGSEREHMQRDAARLLRSQGNATGRGRMRPDGTLRPSKPPRGLLFATGEELPRGQSVHARLFTSEIQAGAINADKLTRCQTDAAAGLYAQATAAFVQWLAPHFDEARSEFEALRQKAREQFHHSHPRTADIRAQLTAAFSIFTAFLVETGVVNDTTQVASLQARVGAALEEAARTQKQFSDTADPAGAFIRLLISAITTGRAHLANKDGAAPYLHEAPCGWRHQRGDWQPQGDRVGWFDGDYVFLDRDAAYRAAQGMAPDGAGIEVSAQTLLRRLRDRGFLARVDENREVLTVRETVEGRRQDVVCIGAPLLSLTPQKPDQPDQPDQRQGNGRVFGRVAGRENGDF
jgi:hypothetical protein